MHWFLLPSHTGSSLRAKVMPLDSFVVLMYTAVPLCYSVLLLGGWDLGGKENGRKEEMREHGRWYIIKC